MRYNVAQLFKEQVGSTRSYQIDEELDGFEQVLPPRVKGSLVLMRTDKGIWATARLETQVSGICSRCLTPFTEPLGMVIEGEYLPTVDIHACKATPASERAEGAFTIDGSHMLDLTEAVRQYRLTSGPMKPLCRADCRGLCPSCGGNLNEGACACGVEMADPRWAPLKQLLGGRG